MASALIAMTLQVIGLGAVLAAISEVWFYPVSLDAHVLWLCAFYGPLAYTAWFIMAQTRVRTWGGAFWGACLFGFFVEGIPVPVLYEAIPFTILWTSISWHALISAALGLWLFRKLMARGRPLAQITGCALAGAYLGAWSVELWSLRTDGGPWVWTSTNVFAVQMLAGWGMFVIGHLALDGAARFSVKPARWELPVFAALTSVAFAVGMLIAVFPLSLILPLLAALACWIMRRDGQSVQSPTSPVLVRLSNSRGSVPGYTVSALIPLCAILTYNVLNVNDIQLESSAIHIMWAGPAGLVLVVWSMGRVLRSH